jgi:hypothetical protein
MTVSIATQTSMVNQLNDYCFRNIWNEVHAEYCINVQVYPVTPNIVIGQFMNTSNVWLALPTPTDQYVVYKASLGAFRGGLPIDLCQWFTGIDIINGWQTITNTYPQSGQVVARGYTYFYTDGTNVYIAVSKTALYKMLGIVSWDQMYVSIFRGDILERKIIGNSFYISASVNFTPYTGSIQTYITNALNINTPGTIVTQNGYEVSQTSSLTFSVGDFIDVLCDNNVTGAFSVNVSNNTTGYFSSKYARYKEIIHIPKSLNPNNILITNNTCTFHVRSNVTNRGVYLHRNDPTGVTQITHNDIGIATTSINAHRADLNQDNVSVYARIRTMNTNRVLLNDAFCMNILYTLTDAQILQFLVGDIDNYLAFWTANNLETSGYINLMFHTPILSDPSLLSDYCTSLGYYTVASILSDHLRTITLPTSTQRTVILDKGYAFICQDTYPMIFLNGIKLNQSVIVYENVGREKIYIGFVDSVVRNADDVFTASYLANGSSQPYIFTPSSGTPSFTVPFGDIVVYKINSLSTPVLGWNATSNNSYQLQPFLNGTLMTFPAESGPGTEVVFGPSLYGIPFLIKPTTFVQEYLQNIDTVLEDNKPIIITLSETAVNDGSDTPRPLLAYNTLEVFVNGLFLIPNLDYSCIPIVDNSSNTALVQVIINNKEYLNLGSTGNLVEVIAHTSQTISSEAGYAFNNQISYDSRVNFVYPGLTAIYSLGLYQSVVTDNGYYLSIPTPPDNGNPYYVQTSLTALVAEALEPYISTQNLATIAAINSYFGEYDPIDPSFLIIPKSYSLYSPYIQAIVSDVINAILVPVSDSNTATFLAQFSAYDFIKQRDMTITDTSGVNRQYADVFPAYAPLTVFNPNYYNIIHQLCDLILPLDSATIGEISS